jgi:Na+/proline symporter
MNALHGLDYSIIVVYLLVSLLLGMLMTRKASASLENYFLAGRSMPWWMLGIAGMTNWFDMTGTMIITSFLYMLGPRGLYIEFRGGAVLVLAFMLCYAGKWHRRSGCMTGAEWMNFRFGSDVSAQLVRVLGAIVGIVTTVGMLAYLVKGCSLFMGIFFAWPPNLCTGIIIALSTLYTVCAGFYGILLTDLVQGLIIMVSCVIVGFLAWTTIGNHGDLAFIAARVTGNTEWTSSVMSIHTAMPKGYEAYESLFMFAMFYLVRSVIGGMGCGSEPRYFGARNDRDCGLQSMLQGITVMFRWPMMIGFAVLGIYLVNHLYPDMSVIARATDLIHSHYPQVGENVWHNLTSQIANHPQEQPAALITGLQTILGTQWQERLSLIGRNGTINPERILPAVLLNQLPVGLKGLILVAMLAALMSTFTSTVNMAAALFVKDVYQNLFRKDAANRELILVSWITSVLIVVVGFMMGILTDSINAIWGWIIMSLTAGGLAPSVLRLYWWRCNAWGCFWGMLLGLVGSVGQLTLEKLHLMPPMLEWQQFIIMTGLSFGGTILGSLWTAPPSMELLRRFYRITRPFGLWKPVKAGFSPAEQRELCKEHRNDILAVPFVMLAQITIFLLSMQLVIHAYDSLTWTLPLFLLGAGGMYWYWWRNLPPAAEATQDHRHASALEKPSTTPEPASGIAAQ